jgi:putative ATP-dependent endonuclease of the OLD family
MRITSLRVQNLRSVRDSTEFEVTNLFALVGENNTGKSNLLRAIEVLVSVGAARLSRSDFYDPTKAVVIKGVFGDLSTRDKQRWRPYLVGDNLTLEKQIVLTVDDRTGKDKLEAEFHGYQAEPKDWFLSTSKIQDKVGDRPKWADIAREAGLPPYFLEDGKATKATFAKAITRYLAENEVEYDPPDMSATQALGLQSNVVAALPRVYLLPAITDYSDEIDRRSSTSTFRRLMAALSERLLQLDPRFIELQAAVATIRALLNPPTGAEPAARIESLAAVETKVAELLKRVMPSVQSVSLSVEVEEVKELFAAGVSLSVNDGITTDVLAKGHGLQRCVVFTLLQTLILNERNQLLVAAAAPHQEAESILLLVEEPELYIHPQLSKLFFDVLASFALTDQVIYTTHSPVFVDAYEAERVAIVTKPDVGTGTTLRSCDRTAFDGLDDRRLFQGFTRMNAAMNEVFFAKRVMLVEGPEDVIGVIATLKALGLITHRPEELEWTVVACGGKEAIPFFQRVLNAFSIPYRVIHDFDICPGMHPDAEANHRRSNDTIEALRRGAHIFQYPVKLEESLGLAKHFQDQYSAHVYFSDPARITPAVRELVAQAFT